jgi:sugar O-acyltransferase (sialic acid O-acetyltransferase NeuD family)
VSRRRIVVIGAGGHAREVLDVVDAVNASGSDRLDVIGVLADPAPPRLPIADYDVPYLGPPEALEEVEPEVGYVIGIGDPAVRCRIEARLRGDREAVTLVHPNVTIGRATVVGQGCVLFSHVSITNRVTLGRHVHVNRNATIGHDVVVGSCVLIGPTAAVSGNVTIGDRAYVGAGASIRERVRIGSDSVVGLGAAVVRDVEPGVTVVGVPAAPIR